MGVMHNQRQLHRLPDTTTASPILSSSPFYPFFVTFSSVGPGLLYSFLRSLHLQYTFPAASVSPRSASQTPPGPTWPPSAHHPPPTTIAGYTSLGCRRHSSALSTTAGCLCRHRHCRRIPRPGHSAIRVFNHSSFLHKVQTASVPGLTEILGVLSKNKSQFHPIPRLVPFNIPPQSQARACAQRFGRLSPSNSDSSRLPIYRASRDHLHDKVEASFVLATTLSQVSYMTSRFN